eukprot:gene7677-9445_t
MSSVARNNKSNKASLKKRSAKYTIDCTAPGGKIFDVPLFQTFLQQRIKVDGKAGNLGNNVTITTDKSKVVVNTQIPFSKRYLKYLTKKFLKKKNIRDFLRVVANSKYSYELRYFSVADDMEEEAEN